MPEIPTAIPHTVEAIYSAIAAKARGGDSRGVPMSDVANDCERAIWYKLRWAAEPEKIDGLKESIFETGRRWEDRLLDDLERAGVLVERIDPATGKQFSVELAMGWLRGKMDGRALDIPEAPKTLHVVETKSHKEKSFKELVKHAPPKGEGLKKSKPDHYAQCQSYMHAHSLTRCLYLAVNKNTDERYVERVEYDPAYALQLEAKVSRVVRSDRAPSRLHDDPKSKAAFACGWCPVLGLCHEKAWARINCRTCLHASLEDGANVRCTRSGEIRTYPEQQAGCPSHRWLPDLVPAEQVDVQGEDIVYRLEDGSLWVDEEGKAE
jgi:hypothetical protein